MAVPVINMGVDEYGIHPTHVKSKPFVQGSYSHIADCSNRVSEIQIRFCIWFYDHFLEYIEPTDCARMETATILQQTLSPFQVP